MFVKYFIQTQERPIGMKYDQQREILVLGGHESLLQDIFAIAQDFFGLELDKDRTSIRMVVSGNKQTFRVMVDYITFSVGLQKLRDSGISITQTKSLERVMR